MATQTTGNAWVYCENFADPEAQKQVIQAALTAFISINYAQRYVNSEDWATSIDWATIQRQLCAALVAVGHPAGGKA